MRRCICLGLLLLVSFGCSRSNSSDGDAQEEAATTDGKLADKTFDKLLKHYGNDANPTRMSEPHRTVFLVYHVDGLIGNGGFPVCYLFDGRFARAIRSWP